MNIFIDTNIFLGFYSFSAGDLEELRKVAKLSLNKKINLFISDHLFNEFSRNRESVIAQAVAELGKSKVDLKLPNLARTYNKSVEIQKRKSEFEAQLKELKSKVFEDIKSNSLKADIVITEVFESANIYTVAPEILQAGIMRHQLRQPPGKKDSCGDAIHWEWLLATIPEDEDLIIISNDADFESPLEKGAIDNFLHNEWREKKKSNISLVKLLSRFLADHFPEIKLADQIDKISAIERLERSSNFSSTHSAIVTLDAIDDFTKDEVLRLINAYTTNDQINWIIGDEDVDEFAEKIINLARTHGVEEESYPLQALIYA